MTFQVSNLLENYLAFVRRFVPEQVVRPSVGIDIGHRTCKIVALKSKGSTHELIHWAIEPIPSGQEKQTVQDICKSLTEPPASITTAVYGKGTLVRYIDMPKMSPDDLRRSFAFEADKYFPFPKDQIYVDSFILDRAEKDNKMAVLVSAVKKDIVDQRIELFKQLELPLDRILLDSIALANVYHVLGSGEEAPAQTRAEDPEAVAILDIGERVSNLTILVDRLPRFCRDIFIGGHDLTCSISNGLGVGLPEAEKLKLDPQSKLPEVLKAADSTIMNLVSELRLSFDYFITEKNVPIGRLLLTGGSSLLEGLPGVFTKVLEVDCQNWNFLQALSLAESVAPDKIKPVAGQLGVAMGLALYS